MTKARWRWWRLSWKRKAQGKFRSVYRPSMDWCWASEEIEKRSPLSYKSTFFIYVKLSPRLVLSSKTMGLERFCILSAPGSGRIAFLTT
ncbi:hypothetical protein Bca4012_042704 [Brassica carinata]|uniref:(rape) hypothetical protein n=1 Tax=Brassica napus TaxID=3708 RepID=A0A816IUZ6_BRANA|nr:unnamed protein product [Brassica napus]